MKRPNSGQEAIMMTRKRDKATKMTGVDTSGITTAGMMTGSVAAAAANGDPMTPYEVGASVTMVRTGDSNAHHIR